MMPNPAVYDKNLFLKKQLKSHYFDKIKPEAVQEFYKDRPNFDYVKEVAFALLEKSITDQLNVVPSDIKCDYSSLKNLSHNVFSWSNAEYLKRRQLPDCVWADVIQIDVPVPCLERFKLQVDLEHVKKFLKIILKTFHTSHCNGDLNCLLWQPLFEAERGLSVLETMEQQNEEFRETFRDSRRFTSEAIKARRTTKELNNLWNIEESMIEAQTVEPIFTRYKINWHQCKTEQVQITDNTKESHLRKILADYKNNIDSEETSADIIRSTYYALAEQYRQDFERLQNRFNVRLEYYENQINYKQLEIAKLHDQEKALRKQIERFHEEIEIRLEKEHRMFVRQALKRRSTIKFFKSKQNKGQNKNKDKRQGKK